MQKGEIINGYEILQDFTVAGGMSKISFCRKNGEEFFIKEFLSPKYPLPDSAGSEKLKAKKRKACEEFEKHQRELNNKIATKVSSGGNLVSAVDFFRFGTSYYKITQKVDTESLSCERISTLPLENILLISRSVVHSIRILHSLNIVHGDLKPDNILIKANSSGKYIGKLIDFDDSYFSMYPPPADSLGGTPEYYSPEQAEYIMNEDASPDGSLLTVKSDIFTLGIILSEYFTGHKPVLSGDYKATWLNVKDGKPISFSKSLPAEIENLLRRMLSFRPENRPDIGEVFDVIKTSGTIRPKSVPESTGSILRGKGLEELKSVSKEVPDVAESGNLRGKGMGIAKK